MEHQQRNHSNKCEECNMTFETKEMLLEHLKVHPEENTTFSCNDCNKTFKITRDQGKSHLRVPEQIYDK